MEGVGIGHGDSAGDVGEDGVEVFGFWYGEDEVGALADDAGDLFF